MEMDSWLLNLTRATTVGCALIAGSFFVFSTMVMPALHDRPHSEAMAAMQSINRVAEKPAFVSVFVITGLLGVAMCVSAIWTWDQPGAGLRLAGGLVNTIGSFGLTMAFHVPKNNALAKLDAVGPDAAKKWADYYDAWVPGNHVRALASTVAVVLFLLALSAD
jgi:uncharacterized membrane protein